MVVESRDATASTHAVPLIAQTPGIQVQGMPRVCFLRGWPIDGFCEFCAAGFGGEAPIGIETGPAFRGARRKRPLLRPEGLKQCVGQTADVKVAADRCGAVLIEYVFDPVPIEQARSVGHGQFAAKQQREIAGNLPVGPRFAGWRDGRAYPRDAALRIGDRALFLAPGGRWQDNIGEFFRIGVGECLLQHHQFRVGKRLANQSAVRH